MVLFGFGGKNKSKNGTKVRENRVNMAEMVFI